MASRSKGKDFGKGAKSHDMGKPKGKIGKDKGGKPNANFNPGKGSTPPFDGYCAFCNKWGHKKSDCRKQIATEGGNLVPPERSSSSLPTAPISGPWGRSTVMILMLRRVVG